MVSAIGDVQALEDARRTLLQNPEDDAALAVLAAGLGRPDRAAHLAAWSAEIQRDERALRWLQNVVARALETDELRSAGDHAELFALFRWGSDATPALSEIEHPAAERTPATPSLTPAKLRHDLAQFQYLHRLGELDDATYTELRDRYTAVADDLAASGTDRRALTEAEGALLRPHFNRLLHHRTTPRVAAALSPEWDRAAVEESYLASRGGLVVIDGFLTADALSELRAFCLESTIWFANRYAHGRIGAFFYDGFCCPLLVQIAEELRSALPEIYVPEYRVTQVWGYKNTDYLPPDATTHADFSALSTNLWVTPDSANRNPAQGGLNVHHVDAPLHWDFGTYNGRTDVIERFLADQRPRTSTIAYRQNRAMIFNADLFHGTQEVDFMANYESHRVNVSWLHGRREQDIHHRRTHRPVTPGAHQGVRGWRSSALRRPRPGRR